MFLQLAVSPGIFDSSVTFDMALLFLFKLLLVIGILLYVVFAGLILRQIQLMSNTVKTSFTTVLWVFGLIHFALGILALLYFLAL